MADKNVPENAGNDSNAPASANEAMMLLPPEEEVARLKKLKTSDLVSELYYARQRLKMFLEGHGIAVPELTFEEKTHRAQLDISSAVYLESFTRSSIRGVGADVEAVSSSVKSFVVLFDSLISTNAFEEVQVTVEGMDESQSVKQLLEDYDNNRIGDDRKVVISVMDLRKQMDALIDDNSSGNKSFDNVDDEAIAATRETDRDDGKKIFASQMGEGSYSFSPFSPYISQEMFDGLFQQRAEEMEFEAADKTDEPLPSEWGAAVGGASPGEVFDDNADVPLEAADVFDDFFDVNDPANQVGVDKGEEVSNDDMDKLFGNSGKDEEMSNDDMDKLFGNSGKDEEMSNDDMDKLFGNSGKDEEMSSDDIDKLLGEKGKNETLSSDDIDKLLGNLK